MSRGQAHQQTHRRNREHDRADTRHRTRSQQHPVIPSERNHKRRYRHNQHANRVHRTLTPTGNQLTRRRRKNQARNRQCGDHHRRHSDRGIKILRIIRQHRRHQTKTHRNHERRNNQNLQTSRHTVRVNRVRVKNRRCCGRVPHVHPRNRAVPCGSRRPHPQLPNMCSAKKLNSVQSTPPTAGHARNLDQPNRPNR
mgnify:FL=1